MGLQSTIGSYSLKYDLKLNKKTVGVKATGFFELVS